MEFLNRIWHRTRLWLSHQMRQIKIKGKSLWSPTRRTFWQRWAKMAPSNKTRGTRVTTAKIVTSHATKRIATPTSWLTSSPITTSMTTAHEISWDLRIYLMRGVWCRKKGSLFVEFKFEGVTIYITNSLEIIASLQFDWVFLIPKRYFATKICFAIN